MTPQKETGAAGKDGAGPKALAKSGHQDDVRIHTHSKPREAAVNLPQGFDALLKPFYQGKSLTDPIDTARVRRLDPPGSHCTISVGVISYCQSLSMPQIKEGNYYAKTRVIILDCTGVDDSSPKIVVLKTSETETETASDRV